ncbi:RNA-directed DNA polymerase [Leptospira wolffii]|uniref:reverse transcriptase domain-containing protein n=1 Tax=Leptospira wolffii TaxID=409998 RepID=UPI001082AE28|nr:reverse transcriptase domain-containing protein [Leptospira wolffii]TGL46866.1 RNA-directed DNA polymerase [Leptospira wolffii]
MQNYFSDDNIIFELAKIRAKLSRKRHNNYFFERIVQDSTIEGNSFQNLLSKILPPRNQWKRPAFKRRLTKDSHQINIYSIVITVRHFRSLPFRKQPAWVAELNAFIRQIQVDALYERQIDLIPPTIIPVSKDKKEAGIALYRPISVFKELRTKILISIFSKYLMDKLDPLFSNSSFAFRRGKVYKGSIPTHHNCIEEIVQFKKDKKNIFVSECDIRSFFDIISHREILYSYDIFKNRLWVEKREKIDRRADLFLKSFLETYSIEYAMKESNTYFETSNIHGKLALPIEGLIERFYSKSDEKLKDIGVPQGAELSTLIANMILHDCDVAMESNYKSQDFLYMRFCDDMIVLSSSKKKAALAFEEYTRILSRKKLLYHEDSPLLPYTDSKSKKDFWNRKSRKAFHWSMEAYPWLSFVGYNIREDGHVRIRKSSIRKEFDKQVFIVDKVLGAIRAAIIEGEQHRIRNNHFSIFERVKSRLYSMSVGRISLKRNYSDSQISWIGGFQGIFIFEKVFRNRLKDLDRSRSRNLARLKSYLKLVMKDNSSKASSQESKSKESFSYLGLPFSYYSNSKNQIANKSSKESIR